MNFVHYKNNLYKNGEYNPDHSREMAMEKAKSIVPTSKQLQYRDALYAFCVQKGIIRDGWKLRRTKQGISSNIQGMISLLKKYGLAEEFFARNAKEPAEEE